jgi:hypothetical protein
MKILIGDKGSVDFESPIKCTPEQCENVIKFLNNIFAVIEIEHHAQARTQRLGSKFFSRSWSEEEYSLLLTTEDTNKVSEMLGRSWMSVDIQRGQFIPEFLNWTSKKGIDIATNNSKELIQEFMKEKHTELITNRNKKKLIAQKQKEILTLREELEKCDSETRRNKIELTLKIQKQPTQNVDSIIQKQKEEILAKIESIEIELEENE